MIRYKEELGIRWHANIPSSPDLNPLEKVWRVVKQRVKRKGIPKNVEQLKKWIQEIQDGLDQVEDIDKYVDAMPDRILDIRARGGAILPY